MIPGVNDRKDNFITMVGFLKNISSIKRVDLLPYHRLGDRMYERLCRKYTLFDIKLKFEDEMENLAEIFVREGFRVQIGG